LNRLVRWLIVIVVVAVLTPILSWYAKDHPGSLERVAPRR
jgi:hypothetical protein